MIKGPLRSFAASSGIFPDIRNKFETRYYGLEEFNIKPLLHPKDVRPAYSKCLSVTPILDRQVFSSEELYCLRIAMKLKDLYHDPDSLSTVYYASAGKSETTTVVTDLNRFACHSLSILWDRNEGIESFLQLASEMGQSNINAHDRTLYLLGASERISIVMDMDLKIRQEKPDVIAARPNPGARPL